MASPQTTSAPALVPSSTPLSLLRAQAQAHLLEIEQEKSAEESAHLARLKTTELHTHPRNHFATISATAKAPKKLRTASDVLERLRWDNSFNAADYVIGYLERFDGIKEIPVESWICESTDEEFIPQHRIKYFKRMEDGEMVWSREGRIDRIFGSGLGNGDLEGSGDSDRGETSWFEDI